MDLDVLKAEIDSDPLARGYSGMTDQQVADSLNNTVDRDVNKTNVPGSEVFKQIDAVEFNAKTDTQQDKILNLCSIENLDPFGIGADIIQDIFGASTTVTTLQGFRVDTVSRAEELGLGEVSVGHVEFVRRLP